MGLTKQSHAHLYTLSFKKNFRNGVTTPSLEWLPDSGITCIALFFGYCANVIWLMPNAFNRLENT